MGHNKKITIESAAICLPALFISRYTKDGGAGNAIERRLNKAHNGTDAGGGDGNVGAVV